MRATVPELDGAVFASTDDDGQVGVEERMRRCLCGPHGLHIALAEVVPDLIAARHEV